MILCDKGIEPAIWTRKVNIDPVPDPGRFGWPPVYPARR
jgi:hypothetical protein